MSQQDPANNNDEKTRPSDEEILRYEKEVRAEEIQKPLVGQKSSFDWLREEYTGGEPIYLSKIESLSQTCGSMRKIRKDGNCFYRAFAFRLCEIVAASTSASFQNNVRARVSATSDLLSSQGYDMELLQDFMEPFADALKAESVAKVEESLGTEYVSDTIVCFLRLLTAAELKKNREVYEAFNDGTMTLDQFIGTQVEPMNVEADQLQMVALSNVLGIRIKVANLDASKTSDGTINWHTLDPFMSEVVAGSEAVSVDMLYRPGHYDVVY
ncbi:peptidase C65 Otubain-domain-containing protein [Cladochytrium replicatum]|nr:peptidase C65 Otubain-domain-containing protein [Cladochytrium replicatum]